VDPDTDKYQISDVIQTGNDYNIGGKLMEFIRSNEEG